MPHSATSVSHIRNIRRLQTSRERERRFNGIGGDFWQTLKYLRSNVADIVTPTNQDNCNLMPSAHCWQNHDEASNSGEMERFALEVDLHV